MADFDKNRFASKKQDWETPDDIFEPLNKEYNFTLDAAANANNTKCLQFLSYPESNAMLFPWGNHRVWLNPPYGRGYSLAQWVKRSYDQSTHGALVCMLIPARTNTNWFHDYCLKYGRIKFIRGRPKFGGAKHGLPQPLCVVIFGPSAGRGAIK